MHVSGGVVLPAFDAGERGLDPGPVLPDGVGARRVLAHCRRPAVALGDEHRYEVLGVGEDENVGVVRVLVQRAGRPMSCG